MKPIIGGYILVLGLIFLSILSCRVEDLVDAVDRYDYIVRLADLARAVMDDTHTVDWDGLQRLQLRYDVNLIEPTNNFLAASSDLRAAYKELQTKIYDEAKTEYEVQKLEKALRTINQEPE